MFRLPEKEVSSLFPSIQVKASCWLLIKGLFYLGDMCKEYVYCGAQWFLYNS